MFTERNYFVEKLFNKFKENFQLLRFLAYLYRGGSNMIRERSNLLKMLLALNLRMDFDKDLLWELNRFELGYEYECETDKLFEKGNWLLIKSLSLSHRGRFLVQMDLIVLTGVELCCTRRRLIRIR